MANRGRYIESEACMSRENCVACRKDAGYRRRAMELYDWDSSCPYGYDGDSSPPARMRKGLPFMSASSGGTRIETLEKLPPELETMAIVGNSGCLLEGKRGATDPMYCISAGYAAREETVAYDDTPNTDNYQSEVYEAARQLAEESGGYRILDVGCGSGYKLAAMFPDMDTTGLEIEPALSYLRDKYPDLKWMESDFDSPERFGTVDVVICSDVVEHIENPDDLMRFLSGIDFRHLVMSTPARDLLHESRGVPLSGPPKNRSHYREWTAEEFRGYVAQFFGIRESRICSRRECCHLVIAEKRHPGIEIDRCGIVARFNNYDTDPRFRRFAGSREDVWITSMYTDVRPRDRSYKYVLCPFPLAGGASGRGYRISDEAAAGHDVKCMPGKLFRELESHVENPSTGIALLWWYHRTFGIRKARLYGFDWFAGRHHYCDEDSRCGHDGNLEGEFFNMMARGEI